MAWKRRSTSESVYVDVDLEDFDTAQLLQALLDEKSISEAEAEFILNRSSKKSERIFPSMVSGSAVSALDEARREILRGRRAEALHYIEEYLGREWIGVLVQ